MGPAALGSGFAGACLPRPRSGPRHRWRVSFLARRALRYAPAGLAVDAGAGFGRLAALLAASGRPVVALDLDLRRLRGAADGLAADSVTAGPPTLACADVTAMPLAAAACSLVTLGEVLEHVEDDTAALLEAKRVLSPGGVLALTVPAGPERYGPLDKAAGHFRRYSLSGLSAQLTALGFEPLEARGWGGPAGRAYDRLILPWAATGRAPVGRLSRLAQNLWWLAFKAEEAVDLGDSASGLIIVARAHGPARSS